MLVFRLALALFRSLLLPRLALLLENLALRHQLAVLRRASKPPRLRQSDRIFWIWMSKIWCDCESRLTIVRLERLDELIRHCHRAAQDGEYGRPR